MTTITLWLLLNMPADPARTRVLETYPTREACEAIFITEHIAGRATRCVPLTFQAPAAPVKGPVQ